DMEYATDLCLCLGTSLSGMNADRIAVTCAERSMASPATVCSRFVSFCFSLFRFFIFCSSGEDLLSLFNLLCPFCLLFPFFLFLSHFLDFGNRDHEFTTNSS